MILLDTSVWIDHLRQQEQQLKPLLERNQIATHSFVIGELALGSMPRYDIILRSLAELPQVKVASDQEVLWLIKQHALQGSGIGYVDAHLLASTKLMPDGKLWSRDKRLSRIADELGIGYAE
ncbi:putative nucleic acid-binding protein [Pararhizobium capsulatum DSM 1112]|uniref:Nucleic acid-binding protein n=1 Tax=Pararhizobium capsulatum DSM 1112 TaxID=1121113 RepID=A0ABU0BN14_9HYPH|nr:PIN domain-containing protein [Pararhizobium capsulatum]MDQ0319638.1 putative nucleic acid-binding protein [Pararhizobium capsulatum DSM 1112]